MGIEMSFLDWLQSMHTQAGDLIMPMITSLGDTGIIWIILAVVLLAVPRTRKSGMIMIAALCLDVIVCNGILKHLITRIRPCDVNTSVQLLIARPVDSSFPSGHTAAAFAAAAALFFAGEKKLWKPALVLAILIAFSRMYLYVHYPTDILAGIAVGIAAGYGGCWIVNRFVMLKRKNDPERSIECRQ